MPREKFTTLTEQMIYILLALQKERSGVEVMRSVAEISGDRVAVGAGTLYTLFESFEKADMIVETRSQGRLRCYTLTEKGIATLEKERGRLATLVADFDQSFTAK